jgi:outer membrane protease
MPRQPEQSMKNIFADHRTACALLFFLLLPLYPFIAAAEDPETPLLGKKWSAQVIVKRYVGSHTSYEFGNPFPPGQAPLSRLEFPLNTWWVGGEVRRSFSRFSAGLEALAAIPMDSADDVMKDSDWDDDIDPSIRTIYSESQCRMDQSYMIRGDVDMKVGDWLGIPAWLDLRPVAGVRWQRFMLMVHDGYQTAIGAQDTPLPGNTLRFVQTYRQYFLGLKAVCNLEKQMKTMPLKFSGQLGWAYVDAYNKDHHLLRTGNRFTFEDTTGDAWHASVGVKTFLTKNIHAGMELEYLRIRSTGTHRLLNDLFGIDMSFKHGVKVWSDQISLMLKLEYLF